MAIHTFASFAQGFCRFVLRGKVKGSVKDSEISASLMQMRRVEPDFGATNCSQIFDI